MNKDKNQFIVFLFAFFGVVIAIIVISSIGTQYLARTFNYSPALGETLAYDLYNPFSWIFWSIKYNSNYPDFFRKFYLIMCSLIALAFLFFVIIKIAYSRKSKAIKDLHGSAHWASLDEIKETGVLNTNQGVYIGGYQYKNTLHYLRHNGPEHVLCFAPTRSGKGVSLTLPTLLAWEESAIILDIKSELFNFTAGWRQKYANNKILKFDPSNPNGSIRFNILEEIRINTDFEIKDTQNIAINIIYKGDTSDEKTSNSTGYFKSEAKNFLVALILYSLHIAKNKNDNIPNLTDIYKFLNDPKMSIDEILEEMLECDIARDDTNEIIQSIARAMKNKASQELSGVIGTTSESLNLYIDPILAKNTAKSDFKINELMNSDKPVSLYLIIPPSNKDRLKPLFNLIINQIFRTLTDVKLGEEKTYKHRLLFMGDELTSVGKIATLEEGLAYWAGYGIKFYGIIQDLQQLYNLYTDKESITSNCHVRIAFAPNNIHTAKLLSEMSGTTTIIKRSITSSGKKLQAVLDNVSETMQEVQRPLITPDECMRIPSAKKDKNGLIIEPGDMLIFISGKPAIYGKQMLYFKDPVFSDRSKVEYSEQLNNI